MPGAPGGLGTGGWDAQHPGPPRPAAAGSPYASWSRRAIGLAVDVLPSWVASVLVVVGYLPMYRALLHDDFAARPSWALVTTGSLLSVASLGWNVYNRWYLAGRTGQSLGRRLTRTWLVDRTTGRPVGMLFAFVRDLLHVLDRPGWVGYLWPLWDERRQTFADQLAQTVVVRIPTPPLMPGEPPRPV